MRATDAMFVIGMIPGITGLSTPCAREVVDEAQVGVGLEEELRDREVGDAQLRGEVIPVGGVARSIAGGPRDARRRRSRSGRMLPHVLDELERVAVVARPGVGRVGRRVAGEGEDVLDVRRVVRVEDLADVARVCG